jgi:hypothetical protein
MTAALPIIRLQCMDCSKFVHPKEVVHIGESVIRCWDCVQRLTKVLETWANPPMECALCHQSYERCELSPRGGMFMHLIDGTLGFLCSPCDKNYVLQRADLYAKTRFGYQERKIR